MLHEGHVHPRSLRVTLIAVHTLILFLVSIPEEFALSGAIELLLVKPCTDDLQLNVGRWARRLAEDGHRPQR